ncbi:hypothetical protein C8R47DRAFT_1068223 [Mycena vitilis]|nr:hypothetical protein C8R47DRAFT_1068223 [Mycena vitilis]
MRENGSILQHRYPRKRSRRTLGRTPNSAPAGNQVVSMSWMAESRCERLGRAERPQIPSFAHAVLCTATLVSAGSLASPAVQMLKFWGVCWIRCTDVFGTTAKVTMPHSRIKMLWSKDQFLVARSHSSFELIETVQNATMKGPDAMVSSFDTSPGYAGPCWVYLTTYTRKAHLEGPGQNVLLEADFVNRHPHDSARVERCAPYACGPFQVDYWYRFGSMVQTG